MSAVVVKPNGGASVAIIQPNYIPWRGYFDIIHAVDIFIYLDDAQYTERDWRNRNKIRLRDGSTTWLTVPTIGGRNQRIDEVRIDQSQGWIRKHTEALRHAYGKTPHFERYFGDLAAILGRKHERLVDLDVELTETICRWLGLERRFLRSSALGSSGTKDERLIDLVHKVHGTAYLSGPAARDYIVPGRFEAAAISLSYHDYSGYPEYPQTAQPFEPAVSVVDLLFAVGPEAPEYIWGRLRKQREAGTVS